MIFNQSPITLKKPIIKFVPDLKIVVLLFLIISTSKLWPNPKTNQPAKKPKSSILATVPEIDPAKPGDFEDFYWPLSPLKEVVKPDGN